MSCAPLVDLASIAENYGQLSGVLAGFAFTALVLVLTPSQARQRQMGGGDTGAPLSLLIAFVALVLTTLLYSLLAGENMEGARARAATVELINGLVFGLAVVTLLQGVTLLMRDASIELAAVKVARFVTVVAFPVLTAYFVAQGAADSEVVRAGSRGHSCVVAIPSFGIGLTAAAAAILTASLAKPAQLHLARYAKTCRVAAPLTVFVVTVVAAAVSGDLGTRAPTFLMSPLALNLFLGTAASLLTIVGLMFSATGAALDVNTAGNDPVAAAQEASAGKAELASSEKIEAIERPISVSGPATSEAFDQPASVVVAAGWFAAGGCRSGLVDDWAGDGGASGAVTRAE